MTLREPIGLVLRRSAGKRKDAGYVSRFSLVVVRRSAGKIRKDAGSTLRDRLGLVVRRSVGKKRKDAGAVSRLGLSSGKAGKRKDAGSVSRLELVVVRLVSGRTQVRLSVSRLGVGIRRSAGKRKDAGSVSRPGVVVGRSAGKRKSN